MAATPPVKLGVIIFLAYLIVYAARKPVEKACVLSVGESFQPKRQFTVDLGLSLLAGVLAGIYNFFVMGFPMTSNLSLIMGCGVAGFFLSLDTALERERDIIITAVKDNRILPSPKRLYSMTRKFSFTALTTVLFFCIVFVLVFTRDVVWLSTVGQDSEALVQAQKAIAYEVVFIMVVLLILVVNLIISYSKNLKLLFDNETGVLERVSQGDLSEKVPVATHDEFGVIAGHTNDMIDGLRHRMQLINALKLAEEIQQNLLPQKPPRHPDLDIAGTSIYCEAIGGDYYDFFKLPQEKLGVIVADASGHGIDAAMHMTAARSFLHFGISDYQGPDKLLKNVNVYVTRDSRPTSMFMSMFFLEIDNRSHELKWVRAGHDPAMLFDPRKDRFEMLTGEGMALGVDEKYNYQAYVRKGWTPGSVVIIGTDGIHETRNAKDEMFGLDRLQQTIRARAEQSARDIEQAVISNLNDFRKNAIQEDDVTLVVVKLL